MDITFIEDATARLIGNLQEKKHEILMQRIRENFPSFDEKKEGLNRFKRIVCEREESGHERYYYNDGTPKGFLLVTFSPPVQTELNRLAFSLELNYY